MNPKLLISLTDLGDSAVISGLVLVCGLYLFFSHSRKAALALVFSFVCASVLISLFKFIFLGCSHWLNTPNLHSPSGHTALSLSVIMTFAMLIAYQLKGWQRTLTYLIAISISAMIAITRVLLHYHTLLEVIAGLVVGLITLYAVHLFLKTGERVKCNPATLLLIILVTTGILHGYRLPSEDIIQMIAGSLTPCKH